MTAELVLCEGTGQPVARVWIERGIPLGGWLMPACPTCKSVTSPDADGNTIDHSPADITTDGGSQS